MLLSLWFFLYLYEQNMWCFSNVSKCFPLFSTFIISIMSSIFPYECPVFKVCCSIPEESLLYFMALLCSLYLVRNDRPFVVRVVNGIHCILICTHPTRPDPTRPDPTRPGLLYLISCSSCNFGCNNLFYVIPCSVRCFYYRVFLEFRNMPSFAICLVS
jgi:hypothetical protein